METFGAGLQVLRKKKNLSQKAFAEIMNVSRQSISKWEDDAAYPEMSKLILRGRYFSVAIDYLVLGNSPDETTANEALSSILSNLSNKLKLAAV